MKKIHIIAPIVLIGAGICIYHYALQTETKEQSPETPTITIKPEKNITKSKNTFKASEVDLKEIEEFEKELKSRFKNANKNNSDYDFKDPMETYKRMELEYKTKDVITPINDSPYVDFDGKHLDFSKIKKIKLEDSIHYDFITNGYKVHDEIEDIELYNELIANGYIVHDEREDGNIYNYAVFQALSSEVFFDYFSRIENETIENNITQITLPYVKGGKYNYSFITMNCTAIDKNSARFYCENSETKTLVFILSEKNRTYISHDVFGHENYLDINETGETLLINYQNEDLTNKFISTKGIE